MAQSLSIIYVHLTFAVKYRQPLLSNDIRDELHAYLSGAFKNQDCPVVEINSVEDHLHVLFRLSKFVCISPMLEDIKTQSSKWMKTFGPKYSKFRWQRGFGAFSVAYYEYERVARYIQGQQEHHRKVSTEEEIAQLMKLHRVDDFNPDYYWR